MGQMELKRRSKSPPGEQQESPQAKRLRVALNDTQGTHAMHDSGVPLNSNAPVAPSSSKTQTVRRYVLSKPLSFGNEEIRGSGDLPSDSEEELEEFRIGLDEGMYSFRELKRMHSRLLSRDAPHDRERREIIRVHSSMRGEVNDGYESSDFSDSDAGSGTDTDGSDTEDDRKYKPGHETERRLSREANLLKPDSTKKKLEQVIAATSGSALDSGNDSVHKIIFKKGTRPQGKVYRKTTNFLYPDVRVGDRAALSQPTEDEVSTLAKLNELLEQGGSPSEVDDPSIFSRFVVAQYRGLFYSRNVFNKQKRSQHRKLREIDRPVLSSAALGTGPLGINGFYYLSAAEGRDEAREEYQKQLMTEAENIGQTLLALRKVEPRESTRNTVGRATENFKPRSMSDIGTHYYSTNYDGYHNDLARFVSGEMSSDDPLRPLFAGLTTRGNPKVSTGDVPTHAARYAFGLKPYNGHESKILEPNYDEYGTPQHPYSGQMYISIHPLADYGESGPEQLVQLQRDKRINIPQVILPERETPFEGYIGPGRLKHKMAAKFPNFNKQYKPVYAEKYGLTKGLFNTVSSALAETKPSTDARVFVEGLLSNYLAMHAEIRAIEIAESIARQNNTRLVYRTGPNSFGFMPPQLPNEEKKIGSTGGKRRDKK